ncbi:hypothetical protein O3M35_006834 [Rhynocoris fuscipes]|uniref:EB domain-containing protein n=1 Tax=Rhynocoris fuscipes TaxID=488301 RepID=A0AAW1DFG4_9HEMI
MAIIDYYIILTVFIASSTGYIIGESCRYDSDCFVEHSYCLRQEICECKENYIATSDLRFCVATVGAICDSKHDCSSLPNSICYEQTCLCDRGFVSDPHNMNCKPVSSGLQGQCEFDLQCQHTMGDYAVCKHGQCQCLPGYIFIGKCIKTRGKLF